MVGRERRLHRGRKVAKHAATGTFGIQVHLDNLRVLADTTLVSAEVLSVSGPEQSENRYTNLHLQQPGIKSVADFRPCGPQGWDASLLLDHWHRVWVGT